MDTISAFAGRVGLTPSALRFYDDCGVLRPAHVDPDSGYRYYDAGQERDAVLLRTLRQAEVPLADITAVLAGEPDRAREILTAHSRRLRARADTAHAAVEAALRMVERPAHGEISVGGAELASAIRQVAPAASRTGEIAQLGCVLVEWTTDALRLVATDRYRLAVRELVPHRVAGRPGQLLIPVEAMLDALPWGLRHDVVRLVVDAETARLVAEDGKAGEDGTEDVVPLPVHTGDYPDYRRILDALAPHTSRIVVARDALLGALATDDEAVVLGTDTDVLRVGDTTVPAVCSGSARLAFDPAVLAPAVACGVGPDVLLEITAADRPAVVRSADQGSFTTLVMPVRMRQQENTHEEGQP
ncbi:MerR family transcriptional regulator [Saccharomonospora xinjiangensis]|uniref:DNA polymerase III subunit beta family protein n=1 Tax=Saccharomonospora xinjiangensis TaxID=75294 RepID=UPI00350ED2EE